MVIYTIINRYMTDVDVKNIRRFEEELISFLNVSYPEIGKSIVESGELSSEMEDKLKEAIASFKKSFIAD